MAKSNKYVGLMSGTSLDGIDAVLVEIHGDDDDVKLLCSHFVAFDADFQRRLQNLCLSNYGDGEDPVDTFGTLHRELGARFGAAVTELLAKAGTDPSQVKAVGSHGVTVRHRPDGPAGFTLQIGDSATLASVAGVDVVSDFRSKDVALGGQGAPLAPAFHRAKYGGNGNKRRCLVNVGGISNVTLLEGDDKVSGFDVGPGNCLMDAWCLKHTGRGYDEDGRWARSGTPHLDLLSALMDEDYLQRPPPKSTGKELFNLAWLRKKADGLTANVAAEDVQCTLAHFTARTVAEAARGRADELLVCGGGAKNGFLMELLNDYGGGDISVGEAEDADWIEAMAFAWMAHKFTVGEAANLPEVTGAAREGVLGALYKAK